MRVSELKETPRGVAERAAGAAIEAAAASLQQEGSALVEIYVHVWASPVPGGELAQAFGGEGFDDTSALLGAVLADARSLAKAMGIPLCVLLQVGRG